MATASTDSSRALGLGLSHDGAAVRSDRVCGAGQRPVHGGGSYHSGEGASSDLHPEGSKGDRLGFAAASTCLRPWRGTHGVDVCSITDKAEAVKRTVALASRTYGED